MTISSTSGRKVVLERVGGVAVVTLADPDRRNVLSESLIQDLDDALTEAESDDVVRAVVLTGSGSAFCAGAQLSTLETAAEGHFDKVQRVYDGFLRVLRCPLPTIAAVNGPAVGAGYNLALACDIRVAGESATFDTRFTQLHLHPGGGHTWLLTKAVGSGNAALACLFGDEWTARQALAVGLVSAVHPDSELVDVAITLGNRLEHHEKEFVLTLTRTLRESAQTVHHADALDHETRAQRWSVTRETFVQNVMALRTRISSRR
ncbi:enoyl-CoA hydratase-related protein [Umezawaea tangerina]|uniref:Enoyl-CoA hydratase n=1 Tax=Umezawaea tangerina TaxID=84725 RepID=A0A2T0T7N5_9PSEU|nr:enoyl-CoA hydratase-related protein [Umezawaea tangerina]PRY41690.1 enoyl-CoA hydratase [Umezawaea tangerina]